MPLDSSCSTPNPSPTCVFSRISIIANSIRDTRPSKAESVSNEMPCVGCMPGAAFWSRSIPITRSYKFVCSCLNSLRPCLRSVKSTCLRVSSGRSVSVLTSGLVSVSIITGIAFSLTTAISVHVFCTPATKTAAPSVASAAETASSTLPRRGFMS